MTHLFCEAVSVGAGRVVVEQVPIYLKYGSAEGIVDVGVFASDGTKEERVPVSSFQVGRPITRTLEWDRRVATVHVRTDRGSGMVFSFPICAAVELRASGAAILGLKINDKAKREILELYHSMG